MYQWDHTLAYMAPQHRQVTLSWWMPMDYRIYSLYRKICQVNIVYYPNPRDLEIKPHPRPLYHLRIIRMRLHRQYLLDCPARFNDSHKITQEDYHDR